MNKLAILVVMASIMMSAVLLATPSLKVANAQMANQTTVIDVDKWIQTLKTNHPALATVEEAKDVKEVIDKIKALDVKEAIKTLIALNIVHNLMEYKAAQEAQ